ncbi:hypothetical protein A3H80_05245 [Candidatus Roizmanbacteria bacterium RIFCSPLOWO2_02_FULL_37_19]|nr:MAG: hypothetical protein A3E10_05475 [Candidatus Roizmanbacteria bacterium RIFCSPHIGHO2_12_FULL_37_23]OGK54658.1 MAG: hypothetical protein A3H80_05245 [Candidatus Roizmanbacteria bacterium RIFCSPLOWO2_02_FULL_37_19]OGK60458.1 MAG: hypothetical protein A3G65_00280 [Candidatus Roizmanbacteria bacterium RIFCSPLOWO2_12_FULL_37_7b]
MGTNIFSYAPSIHVLEREIKLKHTFQVPVCGRCPSPQNIAFLRLMFYHIHMITINIFDTLRRFFNTSPKRENKTREYTRRMIKKYHKTLRRLSYE